jgi:flagellar basal body-associated protein FliL
MRINKAFLRIFNALLLSIIGVLIVLLIVGTIIGLTRSRDTRPLNTEQTSAQTSDTRVFSGLGRLRIPLSNSSILILSIAFPYSANDIAFSEELASKISELRGIAGDYFSALPADKIIQIDEEAAKQEILRRYNNSLRLGRITALYFSDMIIID